MQGKLYVFARRNAKVLTAVILAALALFVMRFEAVDLVIISNDMFIRFEARQ